MTTWYIFKGRGDCGSCNSYSGYYTIHPGRPHKNCQCEIIVKEEKKCDGKYSCGGLTPPRDLGNGYTEQDLWLDVTQPDGSVDRDIVTVSWPNELNHEWKLDIIDEAMADAARDLSDPCPPFLCC
ncbi:MAG: hypothetical protein ABIK96_12475 [bacterium]